MSCVHPIDAYRAKKRSDTGKRGIVFNPRDGYIDQPIQLPCGKCIGCRKNQARTWTTRLTHEAQLHQQNAFITLTYETPPVSISKRDCQLFLKRLRKQYGTIRYFLCGEYGEQTHRAHYHAIIFGQDFLGGATKIGPNLYTNAVLQAIWGHGLISIGTVTPQSCAYVAGYVNKKSADPDTFNLMSRRPGIGYNWLQKHYQSLLNTETCIIEGSETPIPKRYLDWKPDEFASIKNKRATHYRLRTPEQVWKARTTNKNRELNYKAKSALTNSGTI